MVVMGSRVYLVSALLVDEGPLESQQTVACLPTRVVGVKGKSEWRGFRAIFITPHLPPRPSLPIHLRTCISLTWQHMVRSAPADPLLQLLGFSWSQASELA